MSPFTVFRFRKIEHETIEAASVVGKIKTVDLVVNIRKAILNSENPGGLTHMRSIDALRQEYVR